MVREAIGSEVSQGPWKNGVNNFYDMALMCTEEYCIFLSSVFTAVLGGWH